MKMKRFAITLLPLILLASCSGSRAETTALPKGGEDATQQTVLKKAKAVQTQELSDVNAIGAQLKNGFLNFHYESNATTPMGNMSNTTDFNFDSINFNAGLKGINGKDTNAVAGSLTLSGDLGISSKAETAGVSGAVNYTYPKDGGKANLALGAYLSKKNAYYDLSNDAVKNLVNLLGNALAKRFGTTFELDSDFAYKGYSSLRDEQLDLIANHSLSFSTFFGSNDPENQGSSQTEKDEIEFDVNDYGGAEKFQFKTYGESGFGIHYGLSTDDGEIAKKIALNADKKAGDTSIPSSTTAANEKVDLKKFAIGLYYAGDGTGFAAADIDFSYEAQFSTNLGNAQGETSAASAVAGTVKISFKTSLRLDLVTGKDVVVDDVKDPGSYTEIKDDSDQDPISGNLA